MNITSELNDIFNQQIAHELRNQIAYLQIASTFERFQLKNIADYFYSQAEEEKAHALKIIKHLNDRTSGWVSIPPVDSPYVPEYPDSETLRNVGEYFLNLEKTTTESIESIYSYALSISSFIDLPFLSELLTEQVEEEDKASEFALNIKDVKDLVLFDKSFKG